ncbi:hypothetical protein AAF712_009027 [Marasmius tenuissimus]|uniref:Uncharacterized protein n=1 Tax=Marasmius tenuissimus TaxID=585030 RepID=A0ABR2ZR48_9AGAR
MPLSDTDVIDLLSILPTLTDFTFHEQWACIYSPKDGWKEVEPGIHHTAMTVTSTLLERLTAPAFTFDAFATNRYPLLPKLKSLRLAVLHHFDADSTFVEMVKSRWFIPKSETMEKMIEVALTVLYRDLDPKIYEPLKIIERDGMRLTVMGNGAYIV